MEEWIKSVFDWMALSTDNGDGSKYDGFQFTYENEDGKTVIVQAPISWFVEKFGGASVPPTASALKAIDPDDTLGWHRHFDEWVRQGIIQP